MWNAENKANKNSDSAEIVALEEMVRVYDSEIENLESLVANAEKQGAKENRNKYHISYVEDMARIHEKRRVRNSLAEIIRNYYESK